MTEEQIRDGYERLDSSVHPPMDAVHRVEERMAVRRRRRRAGTVVAAAAVVAAVGGYVAVSSGDSDDARDGSVVAVEPPPSALVMTRPDGSTYEFEDLTISCDPPTAFGSPPGAGDGTRVYLYSPILPEGKRLAQPFVMVEAVLDGLDEGRTLELPLSDGGGSEEGPPLTVFVADTEGAPDGNEVVSSGSSTGTLTIAEASCDPTPVLELEVDATLASEEQTEAGQPKQSLVLQGAVR
ncbi:hypothetical protein L2K70_20115 [Nocardioides KLBMP 9356]|uniref:Uncharacterized protein n=1 Tax=Nocardioides potassii TaxID=2911371 RepID=A0ABS9HI98_9ACTN|nr:hypothetical protein [Nocardioides potassii]MCF6379925.1 hypothetical protein [Nocardioides potassii]